MVRSDQIYSTAIIVPDSNNLSKFAEEKLGKRGFTTGELCQDTSVKAALCQALLSFGLSNVTSLPASKNGARTGAAATLS